MSLTKQDLTAIGNLIDERLEVKFEEKIKPIQKDLDTLKKGQRKIKKDLSTVINYFDHDSQYQDQRLDRLENCLDLPPLAKPY